MPAMQKLLLLLLPLAIAACVERDTVPANSAGTPRVETHPSAPSTPSTATTPTAPATTAPAQRTTLPGRGEGELESRPPASEPTETMMDDELRADDMPDGSIDGSIDGASDAPESSDEERNRASSSDATPVDPTRDSAIIDESGATGFGGQVMTPESLGDGEMRPDDDGSIEPDELPMLPADVVDAGPAMIP